MSCMTVVTAILHILSSSFVMVTVTIAGYGMFENGQFFVYPYFVEFLCKSQRKQFSVLLIFYMVGWASGVLIGYFCLKHLSWQFAVIFCIILPIIPSIVTAVYMPESPRYLLAVGDINGAVESLARIVTTNMPNALKQELIPKYTKILHENKPRDENYDENDSDLSNSEDNLPSKDGLTSEEVSLLDERELKISNKDLWQRIYALCFIDFTVSIARNALLYAAGQSFMEEGIKQQCSECSTLIRVKKLIYVTTGSSLAISISYFIIGYLKRRLAMRGLITILAIVAIPFFFELSDWLSSGLFFIATLLTECLANLVSLYCNEAVPSSVRGLSNSLVAGCWVAGSIFAALLSTYFVHINPLFTMLFIYVFILACLAVVYRYITETKDMCLN